MAQQKNQVAKANKPNVAAFLKSPAVVGNLAGTLGDVTKSKQFLANVLSYTNNTTALQECAPASIVTAALVGESLKLPMSPQLGYFYLVPYNNKKWNPQTKKWEENKVATFQMGYRGYLQLAIRSGQYKFINVGSIKQGELVDWNPMTEHLELEAIEDEEVREATPTIGYFATFQLCGGFTKTIFWRKQKMLVHADKYSQAFHLHAGQDNFKSWVSYEDYEKGNYDPKTERNYSSFWYKDFDGMAQKTMLRQLLSKWGIMSVEMVSAFENDMTMKEEIGGQQEYFDSTDQPQIEAPAEVAETIQPEENKDEEPF